MTECLKILNREEASVSEDRVKSGGSVTLGKNETVSVLPLGVFGVDVHFLEVEVSERLCDREGSAGVTRACIENGFNDAESDIRRRLFELCELFLFHL